MPGQAKLEDSNVANLGGKDHKNAVKDVAANAAEWKGAGAAVGIEVWRIEKFKVIRQDKKSYGTFFTGDSYIVLNTYKVENSLKYNVHFWLGAHSTQDEMGTAAYKTVELDTLLGDLPVQYREVQGHESEHFSKLFGSVRYLEGGVETGFNRVKPTEYKPRLMQFKVSKKKRARVSEVPLEFASLNNGDVFLLDNGLELIQWNGSESSVFERRKASEVVGELKEARNGRPKLRILDGEEADDVFWAKLGGGPTGVAAAVPDSKAAPARSKALFQISGDTGPEITVVEKDFKKSSLDNDDVFVVDTGKTVYIWIGSTASADERREAMHHATRYLTSKSLPIWTPVVRIAEGKEPSAFHAAF